MSQFRFAGDYYISQWNGDDLNAGTDPTLPFATPDAVPVSSIAVLSVLGAGVYHGTFSGQRYYQADGKVKWDGGGASNGQVVIMRGIHFLNWTSIGGTNNSNRYSDCIFENVANINGQSGGNLNVRNLFLTDFNLTGTNNRNAQNSIFLGSMTYSGTLSNGQWRYNYHAKNTTLNYIASGGIVNNLVNNIINGLIRIAGVDYESKQFIDGSPRSDANPLIADIVDVIPNFYSQGNFSCLDEDLKFIDIVSRTVEPDSILLQKSDSNGYIGGVKVGTKYGVSGTGLNWAYSGIDTSNPNSLKVVAGLDYGKIEFWGKVSDSLISALTLDPMTAYNFDGSQPGGSAANNNVPDAWNARTTSDAKGTKPNRLTFELRTSKLANANKAVSSDWDNDSENNPSLVGNFYLHEFGQPLLFHCVANVAYGNAAENGIDPNVATIQPFNFRSIHGIITLSNNREI